MDLLKRFNRIPKDELETITPTAKPDWYDHLTFIDSILNSGLHKRGCQYMRNDGSIEHFEMICGCLMNTDYVTQEQREQNKVYQEKGKTKRQSRTKK